MKAVMLAAGTGSRLSGGDETHHPKILLQFGGITLLERHIHSLREIGVDGLTLVVGYRADEIRNAVRTLGASDYVSFVENPEFRRGSSVSLWAARESLRGGGDVLFMDADVLYHPELIARLVAADAPNCFLFDREFEPGDEPVKLCLQNGHPIEFRKIISGVYDELGEWVGFLKLSPAYAAKLAATLERFRAEGKDDQPMEEAVRDLLKASPLGAFAVCDVTDLPWIEIDFAEDVAKARDIVLPAIAGTNQTR